MTARKSRANKPMMVGVVKMAEAVGSTHTEFLSGTGDVLLFNGLKTRSSMKIATGMQSG